MEIISSLWGFYLNLIWPILCILRRIYDRFISGVFGLLFKFKKKMTLPPVFNPILLLPAVELAANIRERKMTSVEVVRAFVTRCSDVNPILNAIVQENFQNALQMARTVDEQINEGYADGLLTPELLKEQKPFFGVPFTVKETISVEGFPHTAGLLARSDKIAYADAPIVQRMTEAGGILLATTNVSELGMWWECSNPLYGRTNNPYDTRKTSGGSSGGEAALMCSSGSPVSIGTDTGGSIRTPAFFCGLFGHKPTAGLVSVESCNISENFDLEKMEVQVAGPITRHAKDIIPVLTVLAGEEKTEEFQLLKKVPLGRMKFYLITDDENGVTTSPVNPKIRNAQQRIVKHMLQQYDIDIFKIRVRDFRNSFSMWSEKCAEDFPNEGNIARQLVDMKGEINVWTESIRGILGRQRYSFASLLQAILAKIIEELRFLGKQFYTVRGKTPPSQRSSYHPGWRILRMKLQRLLGENGVLLYPSHPTFAPFHRESYYKPFNFTYAAVFNALGLPVTQVPLGIDQETGLPLGIQVIGGMKMDTLTIAVAEELEKAFGGWISPAKII